MARIPESEIERLKTEISVERLTEAAGVALKRAGKDRGGPGNLDSGMSGQSAPENGPVARKSGARNEQKVPM